MKLDELEAYLSVLCRMNKDGILMMMLRDRGSGSLEPGQIRHQSDKKYSLVQPSQQIQHGSSNKVLSDDQVLVDNQVNLDNRPLSDTPS